MREAPHAGGPPSARGPGRSACAVGPLALALAGVGVLSTLAFVGRPRQGANRPL